jgi:hypothetical protein
MNEQIDRITQFGKLTITQDDNPHFIRFTLEFTSYDNEFSIGPIYSQHLENAIDNLDSQLRKVINYG